MGKFISKTKEQFIEKANLVHNNKYDYSLSHYTNCKIKIKIICPKHGEFLQTPDIHLRGSSCQKCGNTHKPTTKQFIEKAKLIHGNLYDYSFVNYVKAHSKIKIKCSIHGIFEQNPTNHLKGDKCPKCSGRYKTTEEIITKFKEIHNNKYDYSLVDYKFNYIKVSIICPTHGEFKQLSNNHLKGNGCPKCVGKNKTTDEFINECNIKHNNKYNYSKVNYTINQKKICVICPIHGDFNIRASHHLDGSGCAKCKGLYKTNEEFINECKLIHGENFDYSLVKYKNCKTKVKIICPKHSLFHQTPSHHLSGEGCPSCNESHGERKIRQYFEKNNVDFIFQHKFKNCRDVRPLPFDFYIPELDTCIEFDGQGHFKKFYFEKDNIELNNRIRRDSIKTKYCLDNSIELIRIRYDENIEEKLRFIS